MMLSTPTIPILQSYPKGADPAAEFQDASLTLTYWDLWCLISAKQKYGSNLDALREALIDRRFNERHFSFSRRDVVEDLITLVEDLSGRIRPVGSVDEILAVIPEKLVKKETQKGVKNITDDWGGYYPPSEPMLRSPRRLLRQEAMRGMWSLLPVDPSPFAESLRPFFLPKKKPGFFPKGATFALSRRIDKAVEKTIAKSDQVEMNRRAYRYAVYRAALTLYQEEQHWDDSYGEMGNLGQSWVEALLGCTADDLCMNPRHFLKDLLMFFCWEDYGLSDSDQIGSYIRNLVDEEQVIAMDILTDVSQRANDGFQNYQAEPLARRLERGR